MLSKSDLIDLAANLEKAAANLKRELSGEMELLPIAAADAAVTMAKLTAKANKLANGLKRAAKPSAG